MWTVASLSADLAAGRTTSVQLVQAALERIADPQGEGARTFTATYAKTALAEAALSDQLRAAGICRSPVEGLPVSVKDLYDVAGDVTRAGSKALRGASPAAHDAPVVARLRAAGAVLVGRTNMVEFAFGGVGLNPHYGTPKNPFDRQTGRVPGGSSSGAAVSVADAMCVMALGSDTRGSVRLPAALCGVSGFKPTASRIPRAGAFPLSYTLDSVGPLANSVACCAIFDAILAGATPQLPQALPLSGLRFMVPECSLLDALDPIVAQAFERALQTLSKAGANIQRVPTPLLTQAQTFFNNGGFAGAEAWQIHRGILAQHAAEYDPRVSSRVVLGQQFAAGDYIQLGLDRAVLIQQARALTAPFDALLFPTAAATAPSISEAQASDEAYVQWNMRLLRNTGIANILDACEATVPCQSPGAAPVGLSVMGMGGSDAQILAIAQSIEQTLTSLTARH